MEEQTVRQLHGAVDLLRDATVEGAGAIETVHVQTAHVPYNVLKRIPLIGGPAGRIEQVQGFITSGIYRSVRVLAALSAFAAAKALQASAREKVCKQPAEPGSEDPGYAGDERCETQAMREIR
jgi:hypothetical protein